MCLATHAHTDMALWDGVEGPEHPQQQDRDERQHKENVGGLHMANGSAPANGSGADTVQKNTAEFMNWTKTAASVVRGFPWYECHRDAIYHRTW